MNARIFLKTTLLIQAFLMFQLTAIAADVNSFLGEDFETAFVDGAPAGWTKSFKTGTVNWTQNAGSTDLADAAHGGSSNAILYSNDPWHNQETYLITPAISVPIDTNVVLEFWHKQPKRVEQDTLKVYYNTPEDGNWILLKTYNDDVDNWTKRTIAMPKTSSTYNIGFLGKASYGYGVCIDDVNVHEGTVDGAGLPGDNVTDYYAVVCGISDYQSLSPLYYCDDDARDVKNALLGLGNWKSGNITVLIDIAATKAAIQSAIQNMANTADEDDLCLFYFSGHGGTGPDVAPLDESDSLDEYLSTYNSLDYSYANDIRDDELGDWIAALPTNKYVVVIDSCYSGGQFKALNAFGETRTVKGLGITAPQKGDGFAADLTAAIGAKDLNKNDRGVVISASDDDEESMETSYLQNGVFTYYFVEGLTGLADLDGDGGISAEECFAYTGPLAAAYNPGQHAQINDNFPGELYLTISHPFVGKCTIKAGSVEDTDSISASGELAAAVSDFGTATSITVVVDSNDMNIPCVVTFPVDSNTFNIENGKFSYSKSINGAKKAFKYDTRTHKFSFSANKIDLSGLSSPFRVAVEIGDYNTTMSAKETIVNGKKPIPITLMMGVKNTLRIDKIQVKQGSTTDTLTVKGGFSVENVDDANMAIYEFAVTLDGQSWNIPADTFIAKKDKYVCKKAIPIEGGTVNADFNFKTGAFSLTIKFADITAGAGTKNLDIEFSDFIGQADVVLP